MLSRVQSCENHLKAPCVKSGCSRALAAPSWTNEGTGQLRRLSAFHIIDILTPLRWGGSLTAKSFSYWH